jgi:predicted N-acetyltransferase YhbS
MVPSEPAGPAHSSVSRPPGRAKTARITTMLDDAMRRPDPGPAARLHLRPPRPDDAPACGRIILDAFAAISGAHGFPPDFQSVEQATGLASAFIAAPDIHGVVAEDESGRVIGSNFLTEGDAILGVGPITVAPDHQDGGVGRRLMQAVLARAEGAAGVRLLQAGYHMRSLSLYASLGFEVKEPVVQLQGVPQGLPTAGRVVRPMTEGDIPDCTALCVAVHGIGRAAELRRALAHFAPQVVEHGGRITGYLTAPGFWIANHGVAQTEADLLALFAGAAAGGTALSMLVPTRDASLFRTLLAARMRAVQPLTLMALGGYREPRGSWFPSVFY